ncbi:hypothetical protein HK097_010244 [Rhizophlyctis rosea]|uniref:CBS domain-containing protein n=1 Tax=Rhizophlyctis rosea TaxID=64517 RepID=A0AAD5S9E8_9FUNG|nr:hypothetical protein HK097_010244 [Rhizophlyctis rosea]
MATTPVPTPLLQLSRLRQADIYAKAEFLGRTGSIKDRIAAAIYGSIDHGQPKTFVVGSSADFAISIAAATAGRRRKIITVVPENVGGDKIHILKAFGADIVRTPAGAHPSAPESALQMAKKIAADTPDAVLLTEEDHSEPAFDTLIQELSNQLPGKPLDRLVVPNTLSQPSLQTALSKHYFQAKLVTVPVPDVNADFEEYRPDSGHAHHGSYVTLKEACTAARSATWNYGLLCGIASGAALAAASALAGEGKSETIVVLLTDSAKDYTSTLLDDDWLLQHGITTDTREEAIQKFRGASVEDLQLGEAVSIFDSHPIGEAIELMVSRDYSQLPVINAKRKIIGLISLGRLQAHVNSGDLKNLAEPVAKWMYSFKTNKKFELITPDTPLAQLDEFFDRHPAALVTDESGKFPLAVVTKYDLLKFCAKRGV